jgi:hypothetical protein
MMRWRLIGVAMLAVMMATASASAQEQKYVGGGLAYNIDEPESEFGLTALAWLPVGGPEAIPFKPMVLNPRFTTLPGLDYWQLDADMLWDIPLRTENNFRPYIGMGVGFVHASFGPNFSDNTPLLNFDFGLRYGKPTAKVQLLLDAHYSSGLDYPNTMHLNFGVLVPFGQ